MHFPQFRDAISSPVLLTVADHWHNVRDGDALPGWSTLRPSGMVPALKQIWAYRYNRTSDEFVGRLGGQIITQLIGKSLRGTPLSQVYPPNSFPHMYQICKRVIDERSAYRGAGKVLRQFNREGPAERIILPLASNGYECDGLLGATAYSLGPPEPGSGCDLQSDTEEYYQLQ